MQRAGNKQAEQEVCNEYGRHDEENVNHTCSFGKSAAFFNGTFHKPVGVGRVQGRHGLAHCSLPLGRVVIQFRNWSLLTSSGTWGRSRPC